MQEASPTLSLETVSSLKSIPAQDWDRLAQGARNTRNESDFKAMGRAAESSVQQAQTVRPSARLAESESQRKATAEAREADAIRLARDKPENEEAESGCEAAESPPEEDIANPFISHAFLESLESSRSVGGKTGWSPLHLLVRNATGVLVGAMPVYAKTHSRGEYVFDHAFADAFHRAGGRYYPKLQISVPFTPVTARKFLIAPDAHEADTCNALLGALAVMRLRIGASSVHATFLTETDRARFGNAGYLARTDQQFHFTNPGYASFEDFLGALASRKRKILKRERREALSKGITVEWLTGSDITEAHWDAFFAFYMDTGSRKWGSPYLTRAFFSLIGERMADRILLVMAKRAGRYIAGALNLIGANTLYGRNWGAIEHHPFLHFELCYYQAIDFAIARGLKRVEAGAQGEHKLVRGYRPVTTHSAHYFADAGLRRAVADYLEQERHHIRLAQSEFEELGPFRKG